LILAKNKFGVKTRIATLEATLRVPTATARDEKPCRPADAKVKVAQRTLGPSVRLPDSHS
jgi:hypothetical protein